jgi:alpha-tubulin suppressor-like RCC1 family protein
VHEYTQVWTWGSGFRGQLGHGLLHGRKKSANRPRRVQFPEGHSICAVASGGFHCVALTDSGELFSWGDNAHGQLGYREVGVDCQPIPRYLALRRATGQQIQVKELACGQHHTAALSKDGELWLWGCGKNGQLGNGDRPIRQAAPRPIPRSSFKNREPVRHVACGDKHTCAVDTAGQLYTWGCGAQGQLGHGNLDDVLSPAAVRSGYLNKREPRRPEDGPPPVDPSGQIRTPYRVLSISCGASLTAAIINDGVLLMWGLGHVFQLREDGQWLTSPATEATLNCMHSPVQLLNGDGDVRGHGKGRGRGSLGHRIQVRAVSIGHNHVVLLDDKGDVWGWGKGAYGQLGDGTHGIHNSPRLVLHGKSVASIQAGRYHSMAVTASGWIYSWGCDESGQLGHTGVPAHFIEDTARNKVIGTKVIGAALPVEVSFLRQYVCGLLSCGEHHNIALTSGIVSNSGSRNVTAVLHSFVEHELELKCRLLGMDRFRKAGLGVAQITQITDAVAKQYVERGAMPIEIDGSDAVITGGDLVFDARQETVDPGLLNVALSAEFTSRAVDLEEPVDDEESKQLAAGVPDGNEKLREPAAGLGEVLAEVETEVSDPVLEPGGDRADIKGQTLTAKGSKGQTATGEATPDPESNLRPPARLKTRMDDRPGTAPAVVSRPPPTAPSMRPSPPAGRRQRPATAREAQQARKNYTPEAGTTSRQRAIELRRRLGSTRARSAGQSSGRGSSASSARPVTAAPEQKKTGGYQLDLRPNSGPVSHKSQVPATPEVERATREKEQTQKRGPAAHYDHMHLKKASAAKSVLRKRQASNFPTPRKVEGAPRPHDGSLNNQYEAMTLTRVEFARGTERLLLTGHMATKAMMGRAGNIEKMEQRVHRLRCSHGALEGEVVRKRRLLDQLTTVAEAELLQERQMQEAGEVLRVKEVRTMACLNGVQDRVDEADDNAVNTTLIIEQLSQENIKQQELNAGSGRMLADVTMQVARLKAMVQRVAAVVIGSKQQVGDFHTEIDNSARTNQTMIDSFGGVLMEATEADKARQRSEQERIQDRKLQIAKAEHEYETRMNEHREKMRQERTTMLHAGLGRKIYMHQFARLAVAANLHTSMWNGDDVPTTAAVDYIVERWENREITTTDLTDGVTNGEARRAELEIEKTMLDETVQLIAQAYLAGAPSATQTKRGLEENATAASDRSTGLRVKSRGPWLMLDARRDKLRNLKREQERLQEQTHSIVNFTDKTAEMIRCKLAQVQVIVKRCRGLQTASPQPSPLATPRLMQSTRQPGPSQHTKRHVAAKQPNAPEKNRVIAAKIAAKNAFSPPPSPNGFGIPCPGPFSVATATTMGAAMQQAMALGGQSALGKHFSLGLTGVQAKLARAAERQRARDLVALREMVTPRLSKDVNIKPELMLQLLEAELFAMVVTIRKGPSRGSSPRAGNTSAGRESPRGGSTSPAGGVQRNAGNKSPPRAALTLGAAPGPVPVSPFSPT